MKLQGKKIPAPKPEIIIIPREDGDLIFQARAIVDDKEFYRLCPEPKPARVIKPGGVSYDDYDDASYKDNLQRHGRLRFAWMIINSLNATDGIEWEKVNLNDSSTWESYQDELEESGLSKSEVQYLCARAAEANILTEEKVNEARQRFFAKNKGK